MGTYKIFLFGILMAYMSCVDAVIDSGFLIQALQIYTGRTDYQRQYYATGAIDYSTGGVTFTYPAGLFTQAPQVLISVQLKNLSFSTTQTITPIITSNSASETVVRVLSGTLITLGEASTNDVTVNLLAIGS